MTPEQALVEAIRIVGGKTALAREIQASPQAIGQWKVCPPRRVLAVEDAVNRAKKADVVPTKHDLCPEFYPKRSR